MTPAEKAKELVDRYMPTTYFGVHKEQAKACAIIAVDEILDVLGDAGVYSFADPKVTAYWQSVKEEINKL